MTVLDAPLRSVAQRLIDQFGFPLTYVVWLEGDEDLDTGKVEKIPDKFQVKGVATKVERSLIDGTRIRIDDEGILLAALPLEEHGVMEPSTDHSLEIGGRRLEIVHIASTRSGEEYAIHQLVVRK